MRDEKACRNRLSAIQVNFEHARIPKHDDVIPLTRLNDGRGSHVGQPRERGVKVKQIIRLRLKVEVSAEIGLGDDGHDVSRRIGRLIEKDPRVNGHLGGRVLRGVVWKLCVPALAVEVESLRDLAGSEGRIEAGGA